MDAASPLPPTVQKWNQNIPDVNAAVLRIWSHSTFADPDEIPMIYVRSTFF